MPTPFSFPLRGGEEGALGPVWSRPPSSVSFDRQGSHRRHFMSCGRKIRRVTPHETLGPLPTSVGRLSSLRHNQPGPGALGPRPSRPASPRPRWPPRLPPVLPTVCCPDAKGRSPSHHRVVAPLRRRTKARMPHRRPFPQLREARRLSSFF